MIDLELSWHQAAGAAAGLAVATVALRAARKPKLTSVATFTQESALVLGLFALWQLAGSFAVVGPAGALRRSRWIWHFERAVHLPSETTIQNFFLPHPLVIQFFNLYYDSLHFPVLITCFIWLFVRHRDRYGRWRTTLVAFTGLCLVVQLLPVAPPRMLSGTGLVDTAVLYHQSVYSSVAGFDPDQLSAMPSVHVGWAILVAVGRHHDSEHAMALAGRSLSLHDHAGRDRDRESLLAGRHRGRRDPRPGAGRAGAGAACAAGSPQPRGARADGHSGRRSRAPRCQRHGARVRRAVLRTGPGRRVGCPAVGYGWSSSTMMPSASARTGATTAS